MTLLDDEPVESCHVTESVESSPRVEDLSALLAACSEGKIEEVRAALRKVTKERLICNLSFAYRDGKRLRIFLINQALTEMGVPPCFRYLPDPDTADLTKRFDIFLADVEWISTRYPKQQVTFSRYGRLFQLHAFHQTARFIFYEGKNPAWKIVKGLALTEDQQWECHWLHSGSVNKRQQIMISMREQVGNKIHESVMQGRHGGLSRDELRKTINRRRAIWFCGWMASKRPQRTADLLDMMTGERLARNLVAKQLEKIERAMARK